MSPEIQQIKQWNKFFSTKNIILIWYILGVIWVWVWWWFSDDWSHSALLQVAFVWILWWLIIWTTFGRIIKIHRAQYPLRTYLLLTIVNPAIATLLLIVFFKIYDSFDNTEQIESQSSSYNKIQIDTSSNSSSTPNTLEDLRKQLEAEGNSWTLVATGK
jgi:hypothetical protein